MFQSRRLALLFLSLATFLLALPRGHAQEENPFRPGGQGQAEDQDVPVKERLKVSAVLEPAKARRGATVTIKVTLEPAPGYYTYPLKQIPEASNLTQASVTVLEFDPGNVAVPSGDGTGPKPKHKTEMGLGTYGVYTELAVLEQKLIVRPETKPGTYQINLTVATQVCKGQCAPVEEKFQLPVTVTDEAPVEGVVVPTAPQRSNGNAAPGGGLHATPKLKIDPTKLPEIYAQITKRLVAAGGAAAEESTNDLWGFVLSGIFWGFISLLTPCVFPMIPITVSFFLKQSEQEHHRPLAMALLYTLTIVTVLTLAAVLLLETFQALSQSPWTNFIIGMLFVVFALSLFGMYELELPSGLARFTSAKEGQGGYAGTVFMAFTFTIISFSCVAPFLGGFAGTSAAAQARPMLHTVLGGLAFSLTFAAPFFLLALFPGVLKKLPRSGNWLNSVKVVMGFLELAAALKFLRSGELSLMQGEPALFLTYDFILALWIGICAAASLYLLNLFRLPHDTPSESVGVPRMLFALLFLGLAFLMLPGIFKVNTEGEKQRPDGAVFAWIDSFLLPEPKQAEWSGDLPQMLKDAQDARVATSKRKLVFVDFTGIICTNCRYNENNIFPQKRIKELFKQYSLVQLVTDSRDALGNANQDFQRKAFGTAELPLYVILEPLPDGKIKVHGKVGGKINSVESFTTFLENALKE